MSVSFDAVTEGWIPVVWKENDAAKPESVGLQDLFLRAHEIADIAVPLPPAASGLMRILYVLTARITGLSTIQRSEAWSEERDRLIERRNTGFDSEDVDRILGNPETFNVFGDRPWLQDPRLVEQCKSASGSAKLAWDRATGSNQVFLSHDVDAVARPIPTHEALWHLIAWLYYGPSGRCTTRTVDGRSEANMTAGPLRRTLSAHPLGESLYESLLAGLVFEETSSDELALWEEPELNDPVNGLPEEPTGLPRLLAGRFRHAALLVPDATGANVVDAYLTWAWRQPQAPAVDPYVLYRRNRDGDLYPRYAESDRAIWRDLDSLLRREESDSGVQPRVFRDVDSLDFDVVERLRVRIYGFEQDGQTRDKQYFTGVTPPVLQYLESVNPEGFAVIDRAHQAAEQSGAALKNSLTRAWRELANTSGGGTPWLSGGMARYWSAAEREFWRLAEQGGVQREIRNNFILLSVRAYETVTESYAHVGRNAKAIENQRKWLFVGWQREGEAE